MKTTAFRCFVSLAKIQKQHIQFFLLLVSLMLLVLGAGAPTDGGTVGH
jgi:hypothetical protein